MKIKNKFLVFIASVIGIMITTISTVSTAQYLGKNGAGLNTVKNMGAGAVGNTVGARYSDMTGRNDLYCVQHNVSERGLITYTVDRYVRIDGNTATNDANQSVTSTENGKLAYILNKRDGFGTHESPTTGQRALWGISNSWYENVGKYISANMNYPANNSFANEALISEATNYANSIGDGNGAQQASDNTNRSNISVTGYAKDNVGYIRVGPFNWSFNGNIDRIDVYGDNNNSVQNVQFSRFEGNNEVFCNSSDIVSGQDFYITLRADSGVTKIGRITATTKVTTASTIYTAQIWFLKTTKMQNLIFVDTGSREVPTSVETPFDYDILLTKDLIIEKVDSRDNNIKLQGVGFNIQNKDTGKFVRKQNGQITYVDGKENATEFITDQNGKIEIDGLVMGTYVAYETKNPNYGYKQIDGGIEIAAGTSNQVIANEQIYVKLSGYVWKDIQSTKKTTRNDLYRTDSSEYVDDQDTAFNGITVRLKDKSGNIIKETTTSERGLYSEINGGEYTFSDVLIDQLSNYYVEFEYDGLIYQSVALNLNVNSGSKATDRVERDVLDRNFASVNSTGENRVNVNDKYSITYNPTANNATTIKDSSSCILHANTNDAGYNLASQFKAGTVEIRYVNLGLYEKPQADLSLTQDLQNVNVGVNGYWHVYNYAKRTYDNAGFNSNDSNTWNLGVKFKNSYTGTYKRAIYQSDINYERPDDRNKELQVYLTYKIAITNESSYLTRANSIVDYFDSRYTLVGVGTGLDGQNNLTGNISYQKPQSYNDKYQKCIINVNTTVKSGESNYVYVQFKLDRNATLQIMNNGETLSNRAEINSYTVFKDNNGSTVAAVDKDSVPGNTKIENIATYEDDTDSAPSIQLELADARKIEGTAFVDNTSDELLTGKVRQGNGIFDNGEKTISGVKVTLHELNNSIPDMTFTTDENGKFEFTGYIPGQYTITYTWGDKTYTVQNYKGTVYDSNRNQSNMYWYKDDVDTRRTDAIDDYQTRLAIDKEMAAITDNTINNQILDAYNGGNNHPNITITTMNSSTPTMEFGVEYETTVTDGTINKVEFIVKNVDFGIVERARQQLDMSKRVQSFKIKLANGQTLIDATVDEKGNLQGLHDYVTYMGPSSSNGYSNKGFIKAEIDNELIEGATLEVGYEIKFINNSELDYMSERYYKYGIQEGNVVTLTPSAVVDYLDKNLGFEQDKNSDWKQITVENLNSLNAVKVGDTEFLNSRMILYTEKTATPIKPTETTSVNLNVSKLLTTSSDLAFNNDAETVKVNKPDGSEHKGSVIKYFPSDNAEEVEITPSTGDDRNYVLPIVIGMISLVGLGVGVFVIKKFVINNK